MKNYRPKYLILIHFAFLSLFLNAQEAVILIAPTIDLSEGQETVDVDIKVASFKNVMGMQFSLRWDADILEFMHIDSVDFGLDFIHHNDNFGTTDADKGILTFFWVDESLEGKELIDGSKIFSFKAKVVGNPAQTTLIEFSSDPTAIELSDPDEKELQVETRTGTIRVGGVSSINEREDQQRISITPNPFKEKTSVEFALQRKSNVLIQVFDQKGKIIIEKVKSYGSGLHTIHIHNNEISTAGIYFLNLTTEEFQVSEKLIFVK